MYGRTGTRVRQAVSSSQFPYSPTHQPSRREIPRRAGWTGERTAGLLWACTGARVCGRTGVQVYRCTGAPDSFKFPFPARPLASPAAAKYRARRGGQVRGRQACFGLAQVHGCTGNTDARVHGCTGVQVYGRAGQFQVPISLLARLPVRPPRNAASGGRLRGNRLTWDLHSAHPTQVLRLSIYPIYSYIPFIRLSVYPLPIYSFLNLSVYSQNPL